MYGLQIDPWVDERRDPFKATDAAVSHLSDLVERLGSVYLAAAAYNAGAGRIERGIRRLPGEPDSVSDQTFFQIADRRYLRRETRDYVPKLIAAALIAKQPGRYGFTEIMPLPPLVFDEVTIPDATGLDVLARLADTTVAAMLELNPHFVRGSHRRGAASSSASPRHGRPRRGALRRAARQRAHHVRRPLRFAGTDAVRDRAALSRQCRDAARCQPPPPQRTPHRPAHHRADERARRAASAWSVPPSRTTAACEAVAVPRAGTGSRPARRPPRSPASTA